MNIKKIILGVTTALLVSCQPAMAETKYKLNDYAFFCEHDFVLRTVESNAMRGLTMSNDRYFQSGICKAFDKGTEVELSQWPVKGNGLTLTNIRINGVVYVARKFYLETKIETGE